MRTKFLMAMFALTSGACAIAGLFTFEGTEPHFQADYSVVYAEATVVIPRKDHKFIADITIDIRATLMGSFDAAREPSVRTFVYSNPMISPITEVPKPKSRVVVILANKAPTRRGVDSSRIFHSNAAFMPNSRPLVVVQGFDDPVVQKIIDRLRMLHEKPNEGRSNAKGDDHQR
jgi:hypothetical protein